MVLYDQQEVRDRLERFIKRRKTGAITRVAEASGVKRNWIGEFRSGQEIGQKSLIAIVHALDILETDKTITHAPENAASYESAADHAILTAIVGDMESVLQRLRSPHYSKQWKIDRLRKWLVDALSELDTISPPAPSTTPRPSGQRK
jgi:hypothetical protein